MRFIIVLLRLFSLFLCFIGVFLCVIFVGFLIIALATDINEFADKLEFKYFKEK